MNEAVDAGGPSNLSQNDVATLRRAPAQVVGKAPPRAGRRAPAAPPIVRPFNEVAARLMTLGLYRATEAEPFPGWKTSADRFGVAPRTVEPTSNGWPSSAIIPASHTRHHFPVSFVTGVTNQDAQTNPRRRPAGRRHPPAGRGIGPAPDPADPRLRAPATVERRVHAHLHAAGRDLEWRAGSVRARICSVVQPGSQFLPPLRFRMAP